MGCSWRSPLDDLPQHRVLSPLPWGFAPRAKLLVVGVFRGGSVAGKATFDHPLLHGVVSSGLTSGLSSGLTDLPVFRPCSALHRRRGAHAALRLPGRPLRLQARRARRHRCLPGRLPFGRFQQHRHRRVFSFCARVSTRVPTPVLARLLAPVRMLAQKRSAVALLCPFCHLPVALLPHVCARTR